MVIRASSSRQVEALLADLASPNELTREGAIARLIVIGPRAVQRLIDRAVDAAAAPATRVAALHALEGIGDTRGIDVALGLLDDGSDAVAAAAVPLLQTALASARGVELLDRLTAAALDRSRPRTVRLAAVRAVHGLGPGTVAPLMQALRADPDEAIAMAAGLGPDAAVDPVYQLRDAVEGTLPDAPASLRAALRDASEHVSAQVLHQLVERVRFREGAEAGPARTEWRQVRAAAHLALAHRGSRLALYDLRETLASAREPLPAEFLDAAAAIGDATCLDALAAACSRAPDDAAHGWWRMRLAHVFQVIARREGITRRHAAGKRITSRWREAAAILWP